MVCNSKKKCRDKSIIKDENGKLINILLTRLEWLPNYNIDKIQNLILQNSNYSNDNSCPIIYSSSNYESRKVYTSHNKTDEFRFSLIHATNKNGIRYMYSTCNDKGHFGVSKVIFGDSGINNAIIDYDGLYGMTQHAMAIKIESYEEGVNIKKAIESKNFQDILNSCMWSNFMIDWRLFTNFKRDFWKDFI